MTQLYIVEIIKRQDGDMSHEVYWAYDEAPDKARLKAESKYHEVLSRAAVSEHLEHAAILFTSEGFPLMHQCYKHEAVAEAETVAPDESVTEDE